MKGIILSGGSGTRLYPLTSVVSKQLLPVYDKPMIYYPLSVLMLAGIREVLVISTEADQPLYQRLLGSGDSLGLSFQYAAQAQPNGLAEAFIIGRSFVGNDSVCLILGDNIFHGAGLAKLLREAVNRERGCTLFGYRVHDPQRYGVAEIDGDGRVVSIQEKPEIPKSHIAVTGFYCYDNDVVRIARELKPSPRGELEITDVNNEYIARGDARLFTLGRGMVWLDTGTHDSLLEASHFVHVLQSRQGTYIACIEEIAYRMGYIDSNQLLRLADLHGKSPYGAYLRECAESPREADDTGH
ncbi:MAG TPA: glucose-1-phosphate thymidylyltransferase RfbA [Polyangiaceae bacterium]|jgi:glucose-1-phosphate thymidylyltransferase